MDTLEAQQTIASRQPTGDHVATAKPLVGAKKATNNIVASDNNGSHQADSINAAGGSRFSWLPTFLAFLLLTFNSAMAIARSQGDTMAIAFVGFCYGDLVALFICLKMYESARAGSAKRKWLKIVVWVLTTLLTFAFSYKVAAVMPAPAAVLVWLMSFASVSGGFIAFFVYNEKK
ncbi:unnamed protein product [Urochloa humidicola]